MNVLITGGAGYIGRSLIDKLEDDATVKNIIVIDNMVSSSLSFFIGKKKLRKLKFIKGDILNFDLLENEVKNADVIYHLAGYTKHAYTYEQNIQYEQINQWGTLNLVRAIEKHNIDLKKFVYLSSMAVFGLKENIDTKIELPIPSNAYGLSKYEGEKYVALLGDKYCVKIIRSANVFGFNSGFREDLVLNNFIFNAIINKKIMIYGNGKQKRSFTHLEGLCSKLVDLIFNDCWEKGVSYEHIADFNADMNEIKDWLLQNHIPNLEYTYLNSNLNYDGQSILGLKPIETNMDLLNKAFIDFQENLI